MIDFSRKQIECEGNMFEFDRIDLNGMSNSFVFGTSMKISSF